MSDPDSETAARELSAEYSGKADAYARMWAPVLRTFSLPLLESLPIRDAASILEVCCGTGGLLDALAARTRDRGALAGVDRAEGMLRVARQHGDWPLAVMDAQSLAVRTGAIDLAICAFALFHVADPSAGLREIRRALRPGGNLGLVVWGDDPGVPGKAIWDDELAMANAAPDPRPAGVMNQSMMNAEDKLAGLLRRAGFVVIRAWGTRVAYPWSPGDLLAMQLGCGNPSRRLSSLPPAQRDACIARARERISRLAAADLVYEPEILFAVAAS